jgi:hypothetical protein
VLSRWMPETSDPAARSVPLDLVGAALSVLVLGGSSYALIQGSGGSAGGIVWGAAAVAALALIGLVVWERGRPGSMVPVDLFAVRPFLAANLVTFVVYGGLGIVFFLLTIQLQVSAGWSPLAAGSALLPVTVIMLLLSSRAGAVATRIGPRWPLTVGPLVMAAGMWMMAGIGSDATFVADVLPATVVFGLGLAGTVAPVTTAALGTVPDSRAGAASGTNNAVARAGQLLAVAAVPLVVGLSGDGLSDPVQLDDHFGTAVRSAAGLVALGGVIACVLFRSDDLITAQVEDLEVLPEMYQCGVDGPVIQRC